MEKPAANWKVTVGNKTYGNPNLNSFGESATAPWNDRKDWAAGQVRGSEKGAVAGTWFGTLIMGLMFGWFAWHVKLPLFSMKAGPIVFFFWIFPAIAVLLLGRAIWETTRLKRFGDPVLELNTVPIPLGGSLEGRIALNTRNGNAPEFTLLLACIHRVVTQGSKSDHVREKVLWSAEKKAALLIGGILPVAMDVPADQPQTDHKNLRDGILWRLTVKAPFRGIQFLEKYEVPIYQKNSGSVDAVGQK